MAEETTLPTAEETLSDQLRIRRQKLAELKENYTLRNDISLSDLSRFSDIFIKLCLREIIFG